MAKPEPPVLTDPDARKRYDDTWARYPYENRDAYWLRAGAHGMVCTRCGGTIPGTCEVADFEDFTAKHLHCPLGFGLDAPAALAQDARDPLFEEEGS
jgi:hypothetical protein